MFRQQIEQEANQGVAFSSHHSIYLSPISWIPLYRLPPSLERPSIPVWHTMAPRAVSLIFPTGKEQPQGNNLDWGDSTVERGVRAKQPFK